MTMRRMMMTTVQYTKTVMSRSFVQSHWQTNEHEPDDGVAACQIIVRVVQMDQREREEKKNNHKRKKTRDLFVHSPYRFTCL